MPALTPRQMIFELEHRQALGAEDLIASTSNAAALRLIDSWPRWPPQAAIIVGAQGAGKTHLANVWRLRSNAGAVCARALSDGLISALSAGDAIIVEDIDRGGLDEHALFHLLNLARERQLSVLLTSRTAPGELEIALPDLRSRLRALPVAPIEPPDDALITTLLIKLFADRQLDVEPAIIEYLRVRMERSPAAAVRLVDAADRLSLAMHRKVTRSIASAALEELATDPGSPARAP